MCGGRWELMTLWITFEVIIVNTILTDFMVLTMVMTMTSFCVVTKNMQSYRTEMCIVLTVHDAVWNFQGSSRKKKKRKPFPPSYLFLVSSRSHTTSGKSSKRELLLLPIICSLAIPNIFFTLFLLPSSLLRVLLYNACSLHVLGLHQI